MMKKNLSKRVLFSVFLFLSVFFFPWWFTIALSVFGIFFFKSFYEALIVGVFMDTLYGGISGKFLSEHATTLALSVLFLVSFVIKENFSFSK